MPSPASVCVCWSRLRPQHPGMIRRPQTRMWIFPFSSSAPVPAYRQDESRRLLKQTAPVMVPRGRSSPLHWRGGGATDPTSTPLSCYTNITVTVSLKHTSLYENVTQKTTKNNPLLGKKKKQIKIYTHCM